MRFDLIMQFNDLQQKIINSLKGSYLISAPVGTGKTLVLTERIVRERKSSNNRQKT